MIRSKAIAKKCFECSGNSHKEVTLCHMFDCPLWEYRTGQSRKNKVYRQRMAEAIKRYKPEMQALQEMGVNIARFSQ